MNLLPGLSGLSRVRRLSILVGASLPVAMLVLVLLAILQQRSTTIADAETANSAFGVLLANQAERTMQAVDLVLQEAESRANLASVQTNADLHDAFGTEQMHEFLQDRVRSLPQADAVTVIDATGKLVNFSRYWPVPAVDVSDRDYFQYLSTHDDPTPFVSTPVRNRGDGTWTLYLARRMNDSRGEFLGLMLGAIKLAYFDELYRKVTPPQGGSINLLRTDGTALIRYPNAEDQVGRKFEVSSPWYQLVAAGGGDFRSPGYLRGRPRLVSAHPLHGYPLVVNVALAQDAVLEHWRQESIFMGIGATVAALGLIGFLFVLNLYFAQMEKRNALLRAQAQALTDTAMALSGSEKLLAEKSATLELTLDQMDQGLMMIDADGRVVVHNRRALEILDLPADLLMSRPKFQDVLTHQMTHGAFDPRLTELQTTQVLTEASVYDRLRPDGRMIEVRSVPLPQGGAVRTYTDISARKAAEERMRYFAHHDDLTRLANRVVFLERLNESVARASAIARNGQRVGDARVGSRGGDGRGLAVLFLDLDRFKLVNDTRGHQVGDRLLAEVAARITATLRDTDLAARMGGDEFAIIQSQVDQPSSAHALAKRLLETIGAPYEIQGQMSVIGVLIGIAVFPSDGSSADQLLRNADTALYRAKEDGRNTIRFFEPAMDIRHQERSLMEQDLREAVLRRQFTLAYQPILDADTQEILGFETLLRWHHPTRGPINPDEFIPLAESSGLIVPLGLWALEAACAEAADWIRPARVAVNLSPMQFRQTDLAAQVATILMRTGLPGDRLTLEVTEALLLDDTDVVLATMRGLQQQGILIALDDFGSGHASLSYLRRFPFDHVKIDRSFIQSMAHDPEARAIVESIVTLCSRLALNVVAEGVENEEQLEILRQMECQHVQGYFTGRPLTPEQARALMQPTPRQAEVG